MVGRTTWCRAALVVVALLPLGGCAYPGTGAPERPAVDSSPAAVPADRDATPAVTPLPPTDPAATTGTVTGVVDGDTITVDGLSVRLIGMDTPEVGACGYAESTAAMEALVAGRVVTLTAVAGRDDTDRYGRLLRYVDIGGVDAGQHEIELGLGIARYDGRDGYGTHPRELAYVAADLAAADLTCAAAQPAPQPVPVVPVPAEPVPSLAPAPVEPVPLVDVGGGAGCDPSYPTVCIPPSPPDLDCGDIADRRFTVLPPDPHRFDGNADGVGCEGP